MTVDRRMEFEGLCAEARRLYSAARAEADIAPPLEEYFWNQDSFRTAWEREGAERFPPATVQYLAFLFRAFPEGYGRRLQAALGELRSRRRSYLDPADVFAACAEHKADAEKMPQRNDVD